MNTLQQSLMTEWMRPAELVNMLELGDLIEFHRSSSSTVPYSHWGIYIGVEDGIKMVIHFSTEHGDFIEDNNTKLEFSGKLLRGSSAHVRADSYVNVVGSSEQVRINNILDLKYHPFPPIIIQDRAMKKLGSTGYNLIFNNCEQFAKWARYGRHESDQATTITTVAASAVTLLCTGSALAAGGAGIVVITTTYLGRRLLHRYLPSGII